MIVRDITQKFLSLVKQFPTITLNGPRQSGKTTLVRELLPEHAYLSLEDLDTQNFARTDPRQFLEQTNSGLIIDEAQNVPELFSYIQGIVDANDRPGQFILTGSQNFLLQEKITQSLAGRTAILELLPLSYHEISHSKHQAISLEGLLLHGGYPRLYQKDIKPTDWYSNYISTYIERDVRQIKNISNLSAFQNFLKMCAHRAGQLLNLSSLADDCGITHNTAASWLSILEASYIIFLLRPHYKNFNKRLIKMPKVYFYDTGLLCSLLNIKDPSQVLFHSLKGGMFESFIISEIKKYYLNRGEKANIYFWRDKAGHEIDCLIELPDKLVPIEIKSGKTINSDYFSGINYWNSLADGNPKDAYIVYSGMQSQQRKSAHVIAWKDLEKMLDALMD